MTPPGEPLTQLFLTDKERDRVNWVAALQELHKMLKKNFTNSETVSYHKIQVVVVGTITSVVI